MSNKDEPSVEEEPSIETEENNELSIPEEEDDPWQWKTQLLWGLALLGLVQVLAGAWTLVKNPAMTYAAITGEPYDFHHATKRIELPRIPQDDIK